MNSWEPKKRIEIEYRKVLTELMERFLVLPTNAALGDIVSKLGEYQFANELFSRYAESAARRMVTGTLKEGSKSWREAARQSNRGISVQRLPGSIKRSITACVSRNVSLITSVPHKVATEMTAYIARESSEGRRSSTLRQELQAKFSGYTRSQIALIARTETSKTSTALTRARSEDVGASAYVWRTAQDRRVRPSHRRMEGVVCFWSDPPSPEMLDHEDHVYGHYDAGDIFNCRCYPEPLLRMDQVKWPHKVYRSGSVRYMTRAQFQQLNSAALAA